MIELKLITYKEERIRYIVRRKRDSAIMCGLDRDFEFSKERKIRATAIKTYSTENKAYTAAKSAFGYEEHEVYLEKIREVISNY